MVFSFELLLEDILMLADSRWGFSEQPPGQKEGSKEHWDCLGMT